MGERKAESAPLDAAAEGVVRAIKRLEDFPLLAGRDSDPAVKNAGKPPETPYTTLTTNDIPLTFLDRLELLERKVAALEKKTVPLEHQSPPKFVRKG